MNIYRIQRTGRTDYDEAVGFVIRAENVARAREIAASNCGLEGREAWTNADILLIGYTDQAAENDGMVLRDYRAG